MRNLLEFVNYKPYLREAIEELGKSRKGVRSRFAEAISCRPGYVTQVLDGEADLSVDQGSLASAFLGHTEEEAEYFLLLVMRARAGTPVLRSHLDKQLGRHRSRYLNLKERLKVEQKIATADETVFYSNWQYLAILSLISIPGFQTKEAIAERLALPLKRASEILERLQSLGLVTQKGGRYQYGEARTHLPKESPMVAKHHLNWRLQAMQSIENQRDDDFHYSSVVTISESDRDAIKALLIKVIEDSAKIIAPSPEEKLCSFCIDFFEV